MPDETAFVELRTDVFDAFHSLQTMDRDERIKALVEAFPAMKTLERDTQVDLADMLASIIDREAELTLLAFHLAKYLEEDGTIDELEFVRPKPDWARQFNGRKLVMRMRGERITVRLE